MPNKKFNPKPSFVQLDMFNDIPANNPKPLPLIVASKWNFDLQHYETDDDYLYSVQDWITGLTEDSTTNAQKIWVKAKKELSTSSRQLDYLASNGKIYQMDFVDDKALYLIAQHLRVTKKRPALDAIKSYLAESGAFADSVRLNPSKGISAGISRYQALGKSDEWIEKRTLGVFSRKELTAAIDAAVIDITKDTYGIVTETLYKGLWDRTTRQLRGELNLTPKASIRDSMSMFALAYTSITEHVCAMKLGEAQEVPETVAMEIVYEVAKLIGAQMKQTADYLGIHPLTGTPLLK